MTYLLCSLVELPSPGSTSIRKSCGLSIWPAAVRRLGEGRSEEAIHDVAVKADKTTEAVVLPTHRDLEVLK
jgi:hypothetical protein